MVIRASYGDVEEAHAVVLDPRKGIGFAAVGPPGGAESRTTAPGGAAQAGDCRGSAASMLLPCEWLVVLAGRDSMMQRAGASADDGDKASPSSGSSPGAVIGSACAMTAARRAQTPRSWPMSLQE